MTLNEFALALRQEWPQLNSLNVSDDYIVTFVLNEYPRLYDLLSPTARRLKEISDRPVKSSRWTEKGRLESIQQMHVINRMEAENQLYMNVAIKAATAGYTVETYEAMALAAGNHLAQKDLIDYQEEIEHRKHTHAIELNERVRLNAHYLINTLQAELLDLIDKRDNEQHPEKRNDLTEAIAFKREELHGRRKQAMVSVGLGDRLGRGDQNTNRGGSGREGHEGELEPVPT